MVSCEHQLDRRSRSCQGWAWSTKLLVESLREGSWFEHLQVWQGKQDFDEGAVDSRYTRQVYQQIDSRRWLRWESHSHEESKDWKERKKKRQGFKRGKKKKEKKKLIAMMKGITVVEGERVEKEIPFGWHLGTQLWELQWGISVEVLMELMMKLTFCGFFFWILPCCPLFHFFTFL